MNHTTIPRRRKVAGTSMLIGSVALMIPPLLGPPSGSDATRQRLTDLAANPNPTIAKSLIFQLAVLLLLPGVCAIAGRTRGRGAGAVLSGAAVYGAGIAGVVLFMAMTGVDVAVAGRGPVGDAQVHIADRIGSAPTVIPGVILALLFFHLIGLPWLTFGMVRAGQIPAWLAGLATTGTLAAFLGSGTAIEIAGWELLGVALALVARSLIATRRRASPNTSASAPPADEISPSRGSEDQIRDRV